MQLSMERWYDAAAKRCSVRRYKGEPDNVNLRALQETAGQLCARGVRIELGMSERAFAGAHAAKISGTACFAAFIAKKSAQKESVGYLGEAFILECTALGLGTCWAGASYNRTAVMECLELDNDEKLVLVTAVGIPDEAYSSRPRKPLTKLTGLSEESLAALPDWQRCALECGRRAPSAINAQPWSFSAGEGSILMKRTSQNFGYGTLDCGIAMLHIELGAAHAGVLGEWREAKGGWEFITQLQ